MSLITNRRDIAFLLDEVFGLDALLRTQRYGEHDRASIEAILDAAQAIAEEKYLPCAAKLDANEPRFDGKRVHIIPEVAEALDAYREAGLTTISFDEDVGGMQLPMLVTQMIESMFSAANVAISSYSFLTVGNANMLSAFGSPELKARFLPALVDGSWFGTMCLSEPQAGSSLSDIRTRSRRTGDGHYLIEGTKMWISGGEHDLTENIVHMVLARSPDGPPGVKGLSLFLVPKMRVNDDGSLGKPNNVVLAGLNHKMGHRGTVNTLLNFGESGPCHGYLVGKENEGLKNMFMMMNEARIAVGLGGVASGLAGYLYSLDYARQRPQGRHPQDKDPRSPQVMIIEHADIKRMMMTQKAYVEGGMALIACCAELVDRKKALPEDHDRCSLLLELLTPIAKSWPAEFCLEANKLAIQVLGGYGYTRDYPVERLYRDNRLNHIHEGTHAIHGLDILGRKVRMLEGAALSALQAELTHTIHAARAVSGLEVMATDLEQTLDLALACTERVVQCPDVTRSLANATLYLDAFGHLVVAWLWLRMGIAASKGLNSDRDADRAYYEGKLAACRFFFRYELPKVGPQMELIASLDTTCIEAREEHFIGH